VLTPASSPLAGALPTVRTGCSQQQPHRQNLTLLPTNNQPPKHVRPLANASAVYSSLKRHTSVPETNLWPSGQALPVTPMAVPHTSSPRPIPHATNTNATWRAPWSSPACRKTKVPQKVSPSNDANKMESWPLQLEWRLASGVGRRPQWVSRNSTVFFIQNSWSPKDRKVAAARLRHSPAKGETHRCCAMSYRRRANLDYLQHKQDPQPFLLGSVHGHRRPALDDYLAAAFMLAPQRSSGLNFACHRILGDCSPPVTGDTSQVICSNNQRLASAGLCCYLVRCDLPVSLHSSWA
jgi:hypothetical protein